MQDIHHFWSFLIVFSLGFFALFFVDLWAEPRTAFARAVTVAIPTSFALWGMIISAILYLF